MNFSGKTGCSALFALMATVVIPCVHAQTTPAPPSSTQLGVTYNDKIRHLGSISPLGDDLFGDRTNLYTGETVFVQTDIDLPGNNSLPVQLIRSFTNARTVTTSNIVATFSDWELELPYITGGYGSQWISMVDGNPNARCSIPLDKPTQASPPPERVMATGDIGYSFHPSFFWEGNTLHLPGQNDQKMLIKSIGSAAPADGLEYHWITSERWMVSCLPSTANGINGEAFLARAPNGNKYWFNWIVSRPAGKLEAWYGNGSFNYVSRLSTSNFRALPTRVEDQHGNFVTFTYSADGKGNLISMIASDGRSIQLTYGGGVVAQAIAGSQVWQYSYSSGRLSNVTLPDNTYWIFNAMKSVGSQLSGWRNCADYNPDIGIPPSTTTITHPSGAVGTFEFSYRQHGITDARGTCTPLGNSWLPTRSHLLSALSLYNKTISAPGMPMKSWAFSYSPLAASLKEGEYLTHVYCNVTPCPTTRTLTVTRENGEWDRYTFSQKFGDLEGRMLLEERGNADGVYRRTETQYRRISNGSYAEIGNDPCWNCSREDQMPKPLESKIILQDGRKFTFQATDYDSLARPTRVLKSSAPSP